MFFMKCLPGRPVYALALPFTLEDIEPRSPGLVVMGGDSISEGRGFKSQSRILDGHFNTLKKCTYKNVCLKDEKEAGDGSFKNDIVPSLYVDIAAKNHKIGTVHRVVASNTSGLVFESIH